ncbi:MAG TPA: DUF6364 family protein [Hymenobacter sp.]|jgi:hypothetical protein
MEFSQAALSFVFYDTYLIADVMSITLNLSEELVQQAEAYARQQGRSLDALVEEYLRDVVTHAASTPPLASPVQELYGILSLPADFNYKTQRDEPAS